jgi:hypothetical protein
MMKKRFAYAAFLATLFYFVNIIWGDIFFTLRV